MKAIHLEEIKQHRRERAAMAVADIDDIDGCKNMAEIMAWCKRNGRKPGYGYYYGKAKGMVK